MLRVALTGSIGMGKSTAAAFIAERGVPVWDADAAVHRLYGPGGAGAEALAGLVPEAVGECGVDRARLRAAIGEEPELLARVEALIHPLVQEDRMAFLARAEAEGAPLAVCDIPLLFETGMEAGFDRVIVVSAPADIQRARVMERPGMSEDHLARILSRQTPDAEKRARADHVIDTGQGIDHMKREVAALLDRLATEATEETRDA